jgi:hypothetical protein
MTRLATIAPGQSEYGDRLRSLLEATGIDPEEFESLDYFGLLPFFVLAGASVQTHAHAHGDHVHWQGVVLEVPEDLEEAFYATLPDMLEQAYAEEE